MTPAEVIIRNTSALGTAYEELLHLYGELYATLVLPKNQGMLQGPTWEDFLASQSRRFDKLKEDYEQCLACTTPLIVTETPKKIDRRLMISDLLDEMSGKSTTTES